MEDTNPNTVTIKDTNTNTVKTLTLTQLIWHVLVFHFKAIDLLKKVLKLVVTPSTLKNPTITQSIL